MNHRFAKKSFHLDLATLNALSNYFENGGTIKVVKNTKRPNKGYTVGKQSKVK